MKERVYSPKEDTYLLLKCMKQCVSENDIVLEVGTGSGCVLSRIKNKLDDLRVVGTDISKESASKASEKVESAVVCNLSDCFRDNSIDVIGFNLPYLKNTPTDDELDNRALSYKKGLLEEYLKEADRCLKENGTCIFVVSSKTPENIPSVIQSSVFEAVEVRKEKVFFESIKGFTCERRAD